MTLVQILLKAEPAHTYATNKSGLWIAKARIVHKCKALAFNRFDNRLVARFLTSNNYGEKDMIVEDDYDDEVPHEGHYSWTGWFCDTCDSPYCDQA